MTAHAERYRPMCTTDAQRKTFDRLTKLNKTAWPSKYQGKTVLGECRRYLESCDPAKIGGALYELSTMGCGGFDDIAHYDLNGYRATYPHPLLWINEVVVPAVKRWPASYELDPDGYHSFHVYRDGMHDGEVAHQVVKLIEQHLERLIADFRERTERRKWAELDQLCEELGVVALQPRLIRDAA